jgi:hypothetical protein
MQPPRLWMRIDDGAPEAAYVRRRWLFGAFSRPGESGKLLSHGLSHRLVVGRKTALTKGSVRFLACLQNR